jgi:APA family basic amino acid/polyamine antiporter
LLADFGLVIPPQFTGPTGHAVMRDGVPLMVDGVAVTAIFNLPAFLICMVLALLLMVGVSESAKVNNVIVAVKISVLAAFILVGGYIVLNNLPELMAKNWTPFIPENTGDGQFGVDGIMRAASIVFFAYIGFEAVSTAGQEAKDPKRDMPFGIIGSLVVCTIIYMLVAAIMTLLVPYASLNVPDPVAVVVDSFGPQWSWLAKTIKVGAIIGLTSVVLVLMYAQTRIFYTMARDGLLPKMFSKVHPKFHTPYINTLLVGTITAVAAGFFDINVLGDMTSVGTLAAFAIVCLSVIYLRRAAPDLSRGFSVPFYPFVPILGILSCLYLITSVPYNVLMFFVYFLVGAIILYFIYGMRNSNLQHDQSIDDAPGIG